MMKLLIRCVYIGMSALLLSGCGTSSSSSTTPNQSFDMYTFSLDSSYVSIAPSLVENKQLLHKVIKSFKVPASTEGGFEENLIITRSDLATDIDFEQFGALNTQELSTELAGYTPGAKEVVKFSCAGRDIAGLYVTFRVQDPRYKPAPEVWLAQYQFVDNHKGYILSAAYATQSDQQKLRNIIDTLGCVSPGVTTGAVGTK